LNKIFLVVYFSRSREGNIPSTAVIEPLCVPRVAKVKSMFILIKNKCRGGE
jgi:hypothetical protein